MVSLKIDKSFNVGVVRAELCPQEKLFKATVKSNTTGHIMID